jgi:3-oxoacyl-[acyl-carrier protein] reductase
VTGSPSGDLVIVTGTSGRLGCAMAAGLLAAGYRVAGVSRRPVDEARLGPGYHHLEADLSDLSGLSGLVRRVVDRHGPPYALVNNAAVAMAGLLPLQRDGDLTDLVTCNLVSPMILTKYAVRHMISRRRGRVVTISSIVASTGYRGLSAYAASKAGLEGFTRSLAREVGPRGVTVNAIAPGFLDTAMTQTLSEDAAERVRRRSPLGRVATVEEVAAAVTFLLGPQAAGITGTVLTVDAGSTA